jgi:hypothetical protein
VHKPDFCAVCGALEPSKCCASAEEISAAEASRVGSNGIAPAEACRGSAPMAVARQVVEVGLACAFRQLRVEGVEDFAHTHGASAGGRRIERAARDTRDLKDEARRAR